jgi:hypothetical protein
MCFQLHCCTSLLHSAIRRSTSLFTRGQGWWSLLGSSTMKQCKLSCLSSNNSIAAVTVGLARSWTMWCPTKSLTSFQHELLQHCVSAQRFFTPVNCHRSRNPTRSQSGSVSYLVGPKGPIVHGHPYDLQRSRYSGR